MADFTREELSSFTYKQLVRLGRYYNITGRMSKEKLLDALVVAVGIPVDVVDGEEVQMSVRIRRIKESQRS